MNVCAYFFFQPERQRLGIRSSRVFFRGFLERWQRRCAGLELQKKGEMCPWMRVRKRRAEGKSGERGNQKSNLLAKEGKLVGNGSNRGVNDFVEITIPTQRR